MPRRNKDVNNDAAESIAEVREMEEMCANLDERDGSSKKKNSASVDDDSEVNGIIPNDKQISLNGLQCNLNKIMEASARMRNRSHDSSIMNPDEDKPARKRVRKKAGNVSGHSLSTRKAGINNKNWQREAPRKPGLAIMPPVAMNLSFSVVHFLSAVRAAMLSPLLKDSSEGGDNSEGSDPERENLNHNCPLTLSRDTAAMNTVARFQNLLPNCSGEWHKAVTEGCFHDEREVFSNAILFQELVRRVQMNPGDPQVLETQEPLEELIRGALNIFSSKAPPPGLKGWKPLASHDKSLESWLWTGPMPSIPVGDPCDLQTSAETWGLSPKTLWKLVEAFANWLRHDQETFKQIVCLPDPPPPSMPADFNEKERFRDLRSQKSSLTIKPSSPDVSAYFRKEENLRYSFPETAFAYTAIDGRKAVVAPLRRGGGKPPSKARGHFMLKSDRPPHVTILCLVRDAAARLPGQIGTRADVCTLVRDSQYIVEEVSDAQVNQVVSGALDRLHYERDPCVLFDAERKLWVYLHSDRSGEDFEDDGTSSTKRWKKQKKDNGASSVITNSNDDVALCYDYQQKLCFEIQSSDYNGDSSSMYCEGKAEIVHRKNDSASGSPRAFRDDFSGLHLDGGTVPLIDNAHNSHESHPMGWKVLGINPCPHQ